MLVNKLKFKNSKNVGLTQFKINFPKKYLTIILDQILWEKFRLSNIDCTFINR